MVEEEVIYGRNYRGKTKQVFEIKAKITDFGLSKIQYFTRIYTYTTDYCTPICIE